MKIIITGMNKNQCVEDFYLRQQLKVVPSHYSLIRCLRDMGHEVEQRVVEFGEDLSQYDEAIVFIHNPSGFAGYVYNALYAISQKPNCILAFDDWQTDSIYDGLMALKDDAKLFREFVVDSHEKIPGNYIEYANAYKRGLEIVESRRNRMLLSAFAGGDLSLLIDYPADRLFSYNPNPYHLNRKPGQYGDKGELDNTVPVLPENKEFKLSFASLVQGKTKKWLKNQHITKWLVEYFGSRKDGQDRLTEGEMCKVYAKHWAALMPGYFHAGSGWWRARPLQCADTGTIIVGDYKELVVLYGKENADLCSVKVSDLENMSVADLADFAKNQRDALYATHPLDKQVQQNELNKVLNAK